MWGRRASDKVITKNSGLIHLLKEGDAILADCGFNVPDHFAAKGVKLVVAASTKCKKQLSGVEVSVSHQMSHARIHVARAIGRLKKKIPHSSQCPSSFNDQSPW